MRQILATVLADFEKTEPIDQLDISLPESPVLNDIDAEAFGILCRNLIENVLHHGSPDEAVTIRLSADGRLSAANRAEPIPPEKLAVLTSRFERGATPAKGSGLGLAILCAIPEGAYGSLTLHSSPEGPDSGFEADVIFTSTTRSTRGISN